MTVDVESGGQQRQHSSPNANGSASSDADFSAFMAFIETLSPEAAGAPTNPHKTIMEGGAKIVGHFLNKEDDNDDANMLQEEKKDCDDVNDTKKKSEGGDDVLAELEASMAKSKEGENIMASLEAAMAASAKQKSLDKAASPNNNNNNNSPPSKGSKKKKQKNASDVAPATMAQVFSFLPTAHDKTLLILGVIFGILNGLVFPALAYVFSNSFSDLGQASEGLASTRRIAFIFVGVGFYAFAMAALQNFLFLIVSHRAADNFKKQWFAALLRQDASFHDVHSVSGMATALSSASNKMKRGLGRKFGEGIQFGTTFVGGIAYAFWSSWRVALVILALLPVVSFVAFLLMQLNQNQTSNAQKVSTPLGLNDPPQHFYRFHSLIHGSHYHRPTLAQDLPPTEPSLLSAQSSPSMRYRK